MKEILEAKIKELTEEFQETLQKKNECLQILQEIEKKLHNIDGQYIAYEKILEGVKKYGTSENN